MKQLPRIYNAMVIVLAVVSVIMAIADLAEAPIASAPWFYPIDYTILILFALDYIVRFVISNNKLSFFKKNIFDLLAIIPFNAIFSFLRFFRILRILRVTKIAKLFKVFRFVGVGGRFMQKAKVFLHTNGFIYILYLNIACVALGAIFIYVFENGTTVNSLGDAVWWAFVTASTVGYGDISPSTGPGRCVAAILMVCGIGLISMLTGTIATYFTNSIRHSEKDKKIKELQEAAKSLSALEIELLLKQIEETNK